MLEAPGNEPILAYQPSSPERAELVRALEHQSASVVDIPVVAGGKRLTGGETLPVVCPHDHAHTLAHVHQASSDDASAAIRAAAEAQREWSQWSFEDRAAVFLKAADLLAGPWRQQLNAATMLGQSKTVHQAEIDSACELIDFLRWNVAFARDLQRNQPVSPAGMRNALECRPLEGFVYAVTPFNFTAIGGNLACAPALMGNSVLWKPAATAALSNYFVFQLLEAAGLPPGVINFVPGEAQTVSSVALGSDAFAGLHFTGSTAVFDSLWRATAEHLPTYRSYPRLVGETGGKDFVLAHRSADVAALSTALLRGAFEYQGQKCSAASRAYVPASLWPAVKARLADDLAAVRMGDVQNLGNFMGAVIDRKASGRRVGRRGRRRGRPYRLFHPADRDRSRRSAVRHDARRNLRAGALRIRLSGRAMGRRAEAGRLDVTLRTNRRRLRAGTQRGGRSQRSIALLGRQLLYQRQTDRRGSRSAAVRRRAPQRNQRQSWLRAESAALGLPAHDQGNLRAGPSVRVSAYDLRERRPARRRWKRASRF
jgi:delta-1-pyrroline-5-carboxylate dehydrogenase group 1